MAIEFCTALEGIEFDHEGVSGEGATEFLDELGGCRGGAAGGEEVIDDDDAVAIDGRIAVKFERVMAVFEFVEGGGAVRGEFAGLADGDEGEVEALGDGGTEEEAAGLDAGDQGRIERAGDFGELLVDGAEGGRCVEQRSDVTEDDSGLWKVGDGSDVGSEIDVGGHWGMLAERRVAVK